MPEPPKSDTPKIDLKMTSFQKAFFHEFCEKRDSDGIAYYSFVESYDPPYADIDWFMQQGLIERDYEAAIDRTGLSKYFPRYPYRLTRKGEFVADNPGWIRSIGDSPLAT